MIENAKVVGGIFILRVCGECIVFLFFIFYFFLLGYCQL